MSAPPLTHGPEPEPKAVAADAERQRAERLLLAGQKEALELAISGASLEAVLDVLARTARDHAGDGARAAIFLMDRADAGLRVGAAAGLSEDDYTLAADKVEVEQDAPACGMATCTGQQVTVGNATQDLRWASHWDLGQAQAIGTCWSHPIRTAEGKLLATLAVYHREPRQPEPGELEPMERLAQTAALVIGRHQEAAQRQQAEQAVRASDARWRGMIDALPAAIYTTDAEGRLTHFNPAAVELSGRTPELGTEQWCVSWKLYYPDGKPMPQDQCPMATALREGRPVRGKQAILERPDGKRIWFEPYPSPLHDDEGRVVGGINLLVDITEQKRAEAAVTRLVAEAERQKRLYETIISNTPDLVYVFDLNYRISFANDALLQMWGRTLEDSIGNSLLEVGYESWHAEMHEREIDQVIATKRPVRGMVPFQHATLGRRIYDYIMVPVLDDAGKVEAIAGTTRDVTERNEAQQALQESTEQLACELDAMNRLHALSMRLVQEDELETGLEEVMASSAELLHAGKATVQIYDEQHDVLTLVSAIGFHQDFLDAFQTVDAHGFTTCAAALRRRERVIVEDLSTDPDFAELERAAAPYGVRAALSVPLVGGDGRISGVFTIYWSEPHDPSDRALRLLDLYTQQAARQIERKRAEQAIRESEEHLHAIVQTTPECVMVVAADGTLLRMNPAGLAMVEADSASSVIGGSVYKLIAPEHRESFRTFNERVRRGERGTLEFDFIGLRSTRRQTETHAVPLRNTDGTMVQLALTRDITERKRTEETKARLSAIVDSSDDAIISKDLNGVITSWNTSAHRLFGYTAEEAIGRSITMLIPPDRADEEPRIIEQLKRGERVDHFETIRVRKDGTLLNISLTISPVKDSAGRIVGASKIARDITERKQIEQALHASKQHLKEANATLEQRVAERTAALERRADELRQLTVELNTAEQRERRELAHVLHDNLQQILAVARMRVDMAVGRVEDVDARDRLREATDYINQTIEGMRTLATELSPPMLYYDGLVPTLEWLARHLKDNYGLRSTCTPTIWTRRSPMTCVPSCFSPSANCLSTSSSTPRRTTPASALPTAKSPATSR
ncbi:MAG: PAS domain S-box protein [Phycisphaeraceae bacterium]